MACQSEDFPLEYLRWDPKVNRVSGLGWGVMATHVVGRVRDFIRKTFPERQIYHRSKGTVHFTVLGPWTQIGLSTLSLIFLGWVAYASVNVVFKDQIISSKDARFRSMQQAYEGRISKMQLAYDELNGLLTLAEERFRTTTEELEAKHRQLAAIIAQREEIIHARAEIDQKVATLQGREYLLPQISGTLAQLVPAQPASDTAQGGDFLSPAVAATASIVAANVRASEADERLRRYAQRNYTAQQFVALEARLDSLSARELELIDNLSHSTDAEIAEMQATISVTGLNVQRIADGDGNDNVDVAAADAGGGQGGPFLSLFGARANASEDAADPVFDRQISLLNDRLARLGRLTDTMEAMPLTLPVYSAERLSSGFGPRLDPFTKRWAFHSGLDFAGSLGQAVIATAPGVVVRAERTGAYGNMVEIDHGAGFHTRYGHLKAILVKPGDHIAFQQKIGLMGSTGRSTGTHLHYEIWYDGSARDPKAFLKAARYVFQK